MQPELLPKGRRKLFLQVSKISLHNLDQSLPEAESWYAA